MNDRKVDPRLLAVVVGGKLRPNRVAEGMSKPPNRAQRLVAVGQPLEVPGGHYAGQAWTAPSPDAYNAEYLHSTTVSVHDVSNLLLRIANW